MMLTPMWQGLEDHRDRQAAILREGLNWLADGRLRVDIRARFPLDQSDQAHALQETGGGTGKILLIMPPGTATIDVENARTAS
jgi:NADPH:quinone reductase-like Zn-dependent oxidoreductase